MCGCSGKVFNASKNALAQIPGGCGVKLPDVLDDGVEIGVGFASPCYGQRHALLRACI
jgi:hypothetical protein